MRPCALIRHDALHPGSHGWSKLGRSALKQVRRSRSWGPMCRVLYRLLVSLARLAVRSGHSKDLEIIVLRHQLTVLHRQNNRPALAERAGPCLVPSRRPCPDRSELAGLSHPTPCCAGTDAASPATGPNPTDQQAARARGPSNPQVGAYSASCRTRRHVEATVEVTATL